MIRQAAWAVVMAGLVPTAAAAAPCALAAANYRPVVAAEDPDAGYSAEMHPAPARGNSAGVALVMRKQPGSQSFTFRFFAPNGYGRTIAGLDPDRKSKAKPQSDTSGDSQEGPESTAMFFDANLNTINPLFDEKPMAPDYFILPDMGLGFWYWAEGDRTFVPPAVMWRFAGCRR